MLLNGTIVHFYPEKYEGLIPRYLYNRTRLKTQMRMSKNHELDVRLFPRVLRNANENLSIDREE